METVGAVFEAYKLALSVNQSSYTSVIISNNLNILLNVLMW